LMILDASCSTGLIQFLIMVMIKYNMIIISPQYLCGSDARTADDGGLHQWLMRIPGSAVQKKYTKYNNGGAKMYYNSKLSTKMNQEFYVFEFEIRTRLYEVERTDQNYKQIYIYQYAHM